MKRIHCPNTSSSIPFERLWKSSGFICQICHYTEVKEDDLESYDKIILCGTALKDNAYLEQMEAFSWMKDMKKPILGICAGMQVISAVLWRHRSCRILLSVWR